MLEDLEKGILLDPPYPSSFQAEEMIRERQPEYIIFNEWLQLDILEVAKGKEKNRPRLKFTKVDEMLTAVDYKDGSSINK
jgi:ferredoxin--NADP+ reductase